MRCMIAVAGRPIQFVDAVPHGRIDACDHCGRALFPSVVDTECVNGDAHVWVIEDAKRADEVLSSLLRGDA
jgi:uncharacterized protein YuzB (UPF0349 family)